METILLLIRLVLFGIFSLAGIGKFLDLDGSEKAVKDFGVPDNLAKPLSVLLPAGEILIALLLLSAATSWFGALFGFLLLLIFIGGMLYQIAQGRAPDCHCFGQIHSEPVSRKSLIRNGVFALLAFVLIVSGRDNQGAGIFDSTSSSEGNSMSVILGLATVGLLAAAVYFLKTISEQQTQIMRRIEILELTAHEGGRETTRENLSNPHDGLPIGAPAPDFELPNADGRNVAFEHLLAQAKPMLFFFVSPTCQPCAALLPEIEEWQKEIGDRVNFVFLSSGKAEDNKAKFASGAAKQILLQNDREVSTLFGAEWTPTALLINADGTIASRVAAGDAAIRELVEKTKAQNLDEKFLFVANTNGSGIGSDKLKIGEEVPEFSIEDLRGKPISRTDFQGRKTLVAFWSMTCPHCVNMMEDLRDWDKQKGQDEPNLVVFSDGDAEAHKDLNLQSPILIDSGYKTAAKFGMLGTPSAVLVNEDGKIASETAVGAGQIWSLLGKKK